MKTCFRFLLLFIAALLLCGCRNEALIQAQFEAETGLTQVGNTPAEEREPPADTASDVPDDAVPSEEDVPEYIVPEPEELLAALQLLANCSAYESSELLLLTGTINAVDVTFEKYETAAYAYQPMGTLPVYQSSTTLSMELGEEVSVDARSAVFDDGKVIYTFSDGSSTSEKMTKTSLKKLLLANLNAFVSDSLLSYYSAYSVELQDDCFVLSFEIDPMVSFTLLTMGISGIDSHYGVLSQMVSEWSGTPGSGAMYFDRETFQLVSLRLDSRKQSMMLTDSTLLALQVTYTLDLQNLEFEKQS